MKQLVTVSLIMAALVMCGCGVENAGFAGTDHFFVELEDGVYSSGADDGVRNLGLIVGDDVVIIIDAPGDRQRAENYANDIVKQYPNQRHILLLTSSNILMRSGYKQLKEAIPDLEVWLTDATYQQVDDIEQEHIVSSKESINLGGIVADVIPMGIAATAGDLVVYLPDFKLIFTGELVLNERLPVLVDGDTAQWINRLQEMATLSIDKVLPSQGEITDLDAIDWTRQYLVLLRSQIRLLQGQGHADEDVYYFINVPGYVKYTNGNDLFQANVEYVIREIREKGNEITLPSSPMPRMGPIPLEEAEHTEKK